MPLAASNAMLSLHTGTQCQHGSRILLRCSESSKNCVPGEGSNCRGEVQDQDSSSVACAEGLWRTTPDSPVQLLCILGVVQSALEDIIE